MDIKTKQKNEPVKLAERVVGQFNERVRLSQIDEDQVFISKVASVPTEQPASWQEWLTIKNDGSELYVWDGGAWRTFVSPSGVSGTIDTTATQTITVVNGIITNIA